MSAFRLLRAAALPTVFVVACGCGRTPAPPPDEYADKGRADEPEVRVVRVAAAAGLRYALDDVVVAFREQHPDIVVSITYGPSRRFHEQFLQNDAPFDLFFSANTDYTRRLVEESRAERNSEFVYGVGRLVVWVPKGSPLDIEKLGIRAVVDPSVKKVAVPDPRESTYGRAADAALRSAGVREQVAGRLLFSDSVSQAAQFVEAGDADVALIALSLALAPPLRDKGRFVLVPPETYPLLKQGGVVLSDARDRDAVRRFRDFVLSAEGKAILKRYGFDAWGE